MLDRMLNIFQLKISRKHQVFEVITSNNWSNPQT